MTKIVSNLEDGGSFLIKYIEIEFYSHLGIESCLRDPYSLWHCSMDYIQVTQNLQNCCTSAWRLGQKYLWLTNSSVLF